MRYFSKSLPISAGLLAVLTVCPVTLQAQSETSSAKVFKKHNAPVKAVAFSPNGRIMATGGEDKMIYFWDPLSGELTGSIQNSFPVKALLFTADDNLLAACGNDIKLMDMQGKLIRVFSGYTTDVWSFSYNKATQRMAAGSYAKNIKVWDFLTAKAVLLLEGHERSSLPVCISAAGDRIVTGSLDKSVRLWNASTGAQVDKMELHTENILAVDFHPSGKYMVSASADKTLRLWNAHDGKIIRTFTGHAGAIFDVQFSRDGNHLISCDAKNNIILWETATGKKVQTFTEHTGAVNAVRFNSDGSAFATVSDDRTARYRVLDKKTFLAGSYFEKEIEAKVAASDLFTPRGTGESKQDFSDREAAANKFLDTLYNQYYREYIEVLKNIPVDGTEK